MTFRDAIRVLDEKAITRSGLQMLLSTSDDIEIIAEAKDGGEVVELATSLQPDVILTIFEDDITVFPAVRAGAKEYLLKNIEQEELLRVIHTVALGGAIFSPGIAPKALNYRC